MTDLDKTLTRIRHPLCTTQQAEEALEEYVQLRIKAAQLELRKTAARDAVKRYRQIG